MSRRVVGCLMGFHGTAQISTNFNAPQSNFGPIRGSGRSPRHLLGKSRGGILTAEIDTLQTFQSRREAWINWVERQSAAAMFWIPAWKKSRATSLTALLPVFLISFPFSGCKHRRHRYSCSAPVSHACLFVGVHASSHRIGIIYTRALWEMVVRVGSNEVKWEFNGNVDTHVIPM